MVLGGLDRRSLLPTQHGGAQGLPEQRQRPEALDPPEAGLDVEQGGGKPALLLVRAAPVIDLPHPLFDEAVQGLKAVRRFQTHPELREDPEAVEGQGLLQPLQQTPGGRLVGEPERLVQPEQRGPRFRVDRLLVGGLELAPPGDPVALRQIRHDVLALVPLAALHRRLGPEDGADRRPQPLGAVHHAEEARVHPEAAVDQLPQEGAAHPRVLGGCLHEAQEHLLAGQRDAERDDHPVRREGLTVEEQGHEIVVVEAPLLEGLELFRARPDEAAGDGGGAQPEGFGHRLRAGRVVPATQAGEDLTEKAGIRAPGRLELLVALQGNLLAPHPITDPLDGHRQLLVGEEDRAGLAAPADAVGLPACPAVPCAGELGHLGLHHFGEGLEPQGDQSLDQRDHGLEVRELRVARYVLVRRGFHLALGLDSDYVRHEAAPFLVGSPVCATNHPTVRESLRYFN